MSLAKYYDSEKNFLLELEPLLDALRDARHYEMHDK